MKACVRKPDSTEWRTGLPSQDVFVARQFQHEHFVEAGDRREVESVEALHRREPGGTDPTFDRAAFPVDEFQFDEALLNGGRLYGSETSGDEPLRDLKSNIRSMIGHGAHADRAGLVRELRRLGHNDVSAADYAADLGRLSAARGGVLGGKQAHAGHRIVHGAGLTGRKPFTRSGRLTKTTAMVRSRR